MYCERLVVLSGGRVVAGGTPDEVLTEELIADVYRVRSVVTRPDPGGRPHVRFLGTAGPPHSPSPGSGVSASMKELTENTARPGPAGP